MIKIFTKKIIIFLILVLVLKLFTQTKNIERFIGIPWNIGTRFFPMYDIRGYPYIYPPFPLMYISPYNFSANGDYIINPMHIKKSTKIKNRKK